MGEWRRRPSTPWHILFAAVLMGSQCLQPTVGHSQEIQDRELRDATDMEPDSLATEIRKLETIGLVRLRGDSYVPGFFIADREETEAAYAHARRTGFFLAEEIQNRWTDLEEAFATLSIRQDFSLRDLGFFLVGGRILDIGMLGALSDEGSLLGPAPPRPSPGRQDDRYYFWGVEGDPAHLGRYGENTTRLGEGKGFDEITQYRGVRYDADVVDACLRLFREKGFRFE